ncbi:MAG: Methyl-accepting chemotaxis sensory transducer with Cache sensor [Methanomicrobiales archaeon 53_19]|jgi:methyl-accepting chemotaxis protein|uniref:Cache 3/Cache 2 fusion domain-containing protein n=1 Tax=Methanocalculus sp. TaxID=2004547 RepID=UPI000747684E|nr:Cache 3/Cache 2 fusion domain-containing protein [Methanocalculus sp.]KUK68914.1 MAG: Methyl-accepting chemotaxis sensory transducer with Cache sensor [Methanocalculus sp. 52_23]KUL03856.1 MAG: Methyl-accepting chemotaxis sensory transducer with Cache sensor [Methanomicrobiales archaeon 53_19]HIJ06599.1 HAMP domain-containing protein [Methanocalculus sp.]
MKEGKASKIGNMKIGTKILIICLALVIVPTVLLGVIAYTSASAALEEQVETEFELRVSESAKQADAVYTLTMDILEAGLNVLRSEFQSYGTPQIQNGQLVLVDSAGQVTVVNDNNAMVDDVVNQVGGAATIFQVQGNQAIRVATTVIGADGRRALGTPVSQPVYDAVVVRGETFYGTANVVGVDYITVYEPIRGPGGAVIGILFTGVKEDATLGVLINDFKNTVIGQDGYIYVFNSEGTAVLHPTLEGQSLAQYDFIQDMLGQKEGLIHYEWEGDDKIAAFTYYEPLDWYIAAGADWADFTGPIDAIRNAILIIVIGAVIIGGAIAVLFGRNIARRMGDLVNLGRRVQEGDLSGTMQTDGSGDEIGQVAGAFSGVVSTIQQFGSEMNMISAAASDGKLDIRGDQAKFKGDYALMINGVNDILDAVIGPLNVAAEYVDRISNGDIPEKITDEYKGDFNEIKNNLNKCIDAVNLLVNDANMLANDAVEGKLDTRADAGKHEGDFRLVIEGVNNILDAVVKPIKGMGGAMNKISNGNIPGKITREFKGEYNELKNSVNRCIDAINMLIDDANVLAGAAVEGKLATRADASKHQGDYRKVIDGLNNTLDAVVQPVNEVIRVADSYANADFSTRFSDDVAAKGDMERLKNALNNVSTQISQSIGEVNRMMGELAAISEEANASIEEVSSGAQQIAKNTGHVSENSEKANNGVVQVLRAMEDLSAAVEEVTSNSESVASMARNANDQSREGAKLAAAAEQGIGEISQSAGDVDKIIKGINEQMDQIGKIVGLIADISNQTNLLALNAAIEAARAGDAGRGFAVVAAEVKSLAQESGSSAESIANMIGELQVQAKRAVEAMGTANSAVEAGSDQMEKTIVAFNEIVQSVEQISRAIEEVASASEEQAATVEQITASVHEVSSLIDENAREAGDAAAATEEASAGIDEVARMVENVSAVANKTLQANQQFKLAK